MALKENVVTITSDGKEFVNDRDGAEKHEAFLEKLLPANDFEKALVAAGWKGGALTRKVTVAKQFLDFQANGKVAPPTPSESKEQAKEDSKPNSKPAGDGKE